MNIEAKYYQLLDDNKVKCTLCPHQCVLSLNKTGLCRTRRNIDGKLISLAYANPCAISVDPIEKKPLQHFLPGSPSFSISTAGCNLRCKNCQNASISQVSPEEVDSYHLPPEQVVEKALEYNCKSIAYTYTDPVVYYEYTLETAKIAHQKGLKNVIVSAGYINIEPLKELLKYIDAANIDLKSFDDKIYKEISGVHLQPVLNTLKEIKKAGVWLEITNLIIPGLNDSSGKVKQLCSWLKNEGFEDFPLHFSKFYPTYKLLDYPPTSTQTVENAIKIAQDTGLNYVYAGNIPGHNNENTFCPNCGKKIIKRTGYQLMNNKIKENSCPKCGQKIAGVWN